MTHWKHGGVTVNVNEDGSLQVYAPESNRVLSKELAEDLALFLGENCTPGIKDPEFSGLTVTEVEADRQAELARTQAVIEIPTVELVQDTVPAGEITTTKRPVGRPRKTG